MITQSQSPSKSVAWGIAATALLAGLLSAAMPAKIHAEEKPASSFASQPSNSKESATDRPVLQQRDDRYHLLPQDVVSISFPLSPEFNQTATVQPDGYITLQSVGSLKIQGMTLPQAVDALKAAYSKVLVNPLIDVDLKDFQKPFFVVNGQVGKPGRYDLRYDTTVMQAVAVASGFLPTAKTQVFLYHRVTPDLVEVKKLNLKDLLHGKNVNEDVQMHAGDMIFVPEKFITVFRKYVPFNTGMYLNPGSDLF
jgi:polysaccharide export outer membrane protein